MFNFGSYFLIYFATTAIYVYINTYLPVLFFNVMNIDRMLLAIIQLVSYSSLFVKLLFSILSDKYSAKNHERKPYIVVSGVLLALSFIAITINFTELIAFCVFLTINFFASSLIDVAVKGLIIDSSPTLELKNRKIFLTKVGAALGSMYPSVVFLLILDNIYSIKFWTSFLSFSYLFLIPLMFILMLINEENISSKELRTSWKTEKNCEEKEINKGASFKISIVLMCLYIFFLYSDKLFEYVLSPWIVERFGVSSFYIFSFFTIIGIFINMLGFVIGTFFLKNFNRKKKLIIFTILCGILEVLLAFVDFLTFLIILGLIQIFAGIIAMNLTSTMMDFAVNNKVRYYQIMVSFYSLAVIIFVPLGTLLSKYIAIESLFLISGTILSCSIVSLSLIKIKNS